MVVANCKLPSLGEPMVPSMTTSIAKTSELDHVPKSRWKEIFVCTSKSTSNNYDKDDTSVDDGGSSQDQVVVRVSDSSTMKTTVTPNATSIATKLRAMEQPIAFEEDQKWTKKMVLKTEVLASNVDEGPKSTVFQATLNCLSLLFGLGILSSPYAMARAGWAGVAVSLVVAATYAYTACLMGRCVALHPDTCGTYQDIARVALGPRMRRIITALFYIEITGTLLGYCISIADNLNYIFPHPGFGLPGLSDRNLMIALAALIILPSVWLRDLSALSFTSIWCIVSSLLLLSGVVVAATANHIGFTHPLPAVRAGGVPVAAGLYAFSYGGTSVFPSIYKSMKEPSKFMLALVLSFVIATASIVGLGVAGAYMFGEHTESQVTLSMPLHFISTKIVLWSTIVTPIFKFALQLSPITTALENQLYRRHHKGSKMVLFGIGTLMRSSVLAAIVIGSMVFPYFQYIVALVGSSMTIAICMIFPCIFYLKLFWHHLKLRSIILISILVFFGMIVAACGTIVALQGLVDSKRNHTS